MSDLYPIGAVAAFAGASPTTTSQDAWLHCDGASLSNSDPKYQALFKIIGYTYGGSEAAGVFHVPDYRGQFLRGTDDGSGADPDVARRRRHADEFPRDDGTLAEPVGDAVGTVQGDALARPKTPFTALFPHLPVDDKSTAATIFNPPHASKWQGGSPAIATNTDGGDAETRPVNVYVEFYIKYSHGA